MAKRQELIEIELPMLPATDWWWLLEFTLFVLVIGFIILVILWVRRFFWGSLKIQFLIKKQILQLAEIQNFFVPNLPRLKMYSLFIEAKNNGDISRDFSQELGDRFNKICFSGKDVSGEIFEKLLADFLQELKLNQPKLLSVMLGMIRWQR
jgi:hypothetical protein